MSARMAGRMLHAAMDDPPRTPLWRRVALALSALLFLNGMLSFTTWWPTPGILPDERLAPEFVWLWLVLLGTLRLSGDLSRRAVNVLALGYLLLVLGRYLDVTAPGLFGREVNLYWDGAQIPRFLWVTAQDMPWWVSAGALAGVALCLNRYMTFVGVRRSARARLPAWRFAFGYFTDRCAGPSRSPPPRRRPTHCAPDGCGC
ncbi:MAG: hypothetical protein IPL03_17075 [Sterolibacteriaceae bacterium]|nr:hypothetical protein [Candidatus Methylophosphatis haderslevensis]